MLSVADLRRWKEASTRNTLTTLAIALILAFAAAGLACHTAPHAEPGEYYVELNGQVTQVAKITQAGDAYNMAWFNNGSWVPATAPVKQLSQAELGKLFTGPVDKLAALQSKELTIVFAPKGWTQVFLGHNGANNTEFKTSTGYVWISPLGLMDLSKR